ncbi:hypothetical protein, partial [Blautia massiliensis (ex Durand et al. 2017)]|uniref:hypothetical protein n=1 Tax=Blautia massiliensis (ex Durand et al. 2017) TaxID=1737424 RepID=UPI00242C7C98
NKNEVFVLDFQNDPADIKAAFDKYYKTTILSGETDVNKLNDLIECQTAHCGRGKSHFIFGGLASPIVPYRNLTQTTDGITADCRSLV